MLWNLHVITSSTFLTSACALISSTNSTLTSIALNILKKKGGRREGETLIDPTNSNITGFQRIKKHLTILEAFVLQ